MNVNEKVKKNDVCVWGGVKMSTIRIYSSQKIFSNYKKKKHFKNKNRFSNKISFANSDSTWYHNIKT